MTPDIRLQYILRLCALEHDKQLSGDLRRHSDEEIKALEGEIVRQRVAGCCALNINTLYTSEVELVQLKERLMSNVIGTYISNRTALSIFADVAKILRSEGVRFVALKGIALMQNLYSDISQRPMSDIDLLVAADDVVRAREALTRSGALVTAWNTTLKHYEHERAHDEALIYKGTLVELHRSLFAESSRQNPTDIFSRTTPQNDYLIFDDATMGYHLIMHAYGHMLHGGLQLIWLVDIAKLIERQSDVVVFVREMLEVVPRCRSKMLKIIALCLPILTESKRTTLAKTFGIKAKYTTSRTMSGKNVGFKIALYGSKIELLKHLVRQSKRGAVTEVVEIVRRWSKVRQTRSRETGKSLWQCYLDYFFHQK